MGPGPVYSRSKAYTGLNTSGAPNGPAGVSGLYDQGDNWSVSQGGIWMSAGGPSSTASASVYAASGNGPFACSSPSGTECLTPGNVVYWGESVMKFPAANMSNPATPTDFYAPNEQRYTANSTGDPDPSAYQTGELSRLDLDFGSTPPVIIPLSGAPDFAMVGDKSGYMYVVPAEANGTSLTVSMGNFSTGDMNLMTDAVSTQYPFPASQLPQYPNTGHPVCPLNTDGAPWTNNGTSCDEIHEIAFLDNLAFVWPLNESVEAFAGVATPGTGTYNYRFNTTAVINPCPAPFTGLPTNCTGAHPQFPGTGGSVGAMAIASESTGDGPIATLWAITPEPSEGVWGWLYAYGIDSTVGSQSLSYIWDSGTGLKNCSSSPPADGWLATSFTEPTLANGAAYVPSVCVVTGTSTQYVNCSKVPSAHIASGILVFSACP